MSREAWLRWGVLILASLCVLLVALAEPEAGTRRSRPATAGQETGRSSPSARTSPEPVQAAPPVTQAPPAEPAPQPEAATPSVPEPEPPATPEPEPTPPSATEPETPGTTGPSPQPPAEKPSVRPAVDPVASRTPTEEATEAGPLVRTAAASPEDDSPVPEGTAVLKGFIRQPDGTPVQGLEVYLLRGRGRSSVAATFTGSEGEYSFPEIPSGYYRLAIGPEAEPLGFAPDRLRLEPGDNRYDLRSPRLGHLEVEVRDRDGEGREGVRIVAKERFGREFEGLTDKDGRIRFSNLPVSEYRVVLYRGKRRVDQQNRPVMARLTAKVEFTWSEEEPDGKGGSP